MLQQHQAEGRSSCLPQLSTFRVMVYQVLDLVVIYVRFRRSLWIALGSCASYIMVFFCVRLCFCSFNTLVFSPCPNFAWTLFHDRRPPAHFPFAAAAHAFILSRPAVDIYHRSSIQEDKNAYCCHGSRSDGMFCCSLPSRALCVVLLRGICVLFWVYGLPQSFSSSFLKLNTNK